MNQTTINDLHGKVLRETFGKRLNDSDAFLVFVLFHSFRFILSGEVLSDRPGIQEVSPLTQRCASEALASAWSECGGERASPDFWYWRWNGDWGAYEHAEHLSREESERLEQLRNSLEKHPFVNRIVPEL